MTGRRAILAAILSGLIAACGANGVPSPPQVATLHDVAVPATVTPTAKPITSPPPTNSLPSLSPSPNPPPVPTTTLDPVPPKPAGVAFDQQYGESDAEGEADHTQTVTWRTPRSAGVEIRVYGVTKCIAAPEDPAPGTSGPCLVTGTPLPASVRTLLGTAPASNGGMSWSWREGSGCDIGLAHDPSRPVYFAVVLAAYNASGHSIFAIAEPGRWFEPDGNDTVC